VHWLTWRQIWDFLKSWQGVAVAALAGLGTVYYGPRKMLETYDWYLDRFFDSKVREFLESNVTPEYLTVHGPRRWGVAKSIPDISAATRMSEKRVTACIERLKKKKLVTRQGDDWSIVV